MKNQLFRTYSLIALSIPAALFTIAPNAQALSGPRVILGSTATTTLTPVAGTAVGNLTNQSGLSANYTSGVTDFDSYVATTTSSSGPSDTFAFSGIPGIITFDLGASHTLEALALWPFLSSTASIAGFTLYADTNADPSFLGTSIGSFNAIFPPSDPVGAQVFTFASPTATQFVQMEITSNLVGNTNLTTLGEVAFAEPVPWETDALPVIGSALFFAGGVWAKRKLAKPLDKE
jgi:hypothetical protein